MSLAVLNEVATEMRRLAIAGSVVAPGDFRLKKLIPLLEQAGVQAPVFARIAEHAGAVVASKEAGSAAALLELAALVNAVLYTQGQTGLPGPLDAIDTAELKITTQASARKLMPVIDVLRSTGGGRFDVVTEAYENGTFNDLRLVKPSLAALDDGYGEIADFIADKVLPLYGRAILPELRAKFDAKGKAGHARRLKLMHRLDPAGTRETVLKSIEEGLKVVRVAAIECLGVDDLPLIREFTQDRSGELRAAAYKALAVLDQPDAEQWLIDAINPKQFDDIYQGLRQTRNPRVLGALVAAARQTMTDFRKTKDKNSIDELGPWLKSLLWAISYHTRHDSGCEGLLCETVGELSDWYSRNGTKFEGRAIAEQVASDLCTGTRTMQDAIANAHRIIPPRLRHDCVDAAVNSWPPEKVFDVFSLYFTQPAKEGLKRNEIEDAEEAVISRLNPINPDAPQPDLRWIDLAVRLGHFRLLQFTVRPGFPKAVKWLEQQFAKSKLDHPLSAFIGTMVQAGCPGAAEAIVQLVVKQSKKIGALAVNEILRHIPDLPRSSLPVLEAAVPRIPEMHRDLYVKKLEELRTTPEALN